MNRIAIFVDVQNIYYTTRQVYGRQFDYRKLWARIESHGAIVSATAYAIERNDPGQLKFQNALRSIGFDVALKPFIRRRDGSAKGDWDVGITIDMLEVAPEVDTVVLLSGDGDFDLVLEKISRDFQVRTEVYAVPGLVGQSLVKAASVVHFIDQQLLI